MQSQNSDNEDGASDDEEIVEMDDVLPEPLKIKSYKEALSELNHVTNFFTAQGASQLADDVCVLVLRFPSQLSSCFLVLYKSASHHQGQTPYL